MSYLARYIQEYMAENYEKIIPIEACEEALTRAKRDGKKQGWSIEQVFGASINLLKNIRFNLSA